MNGVEYASLASVVAAIRKPLSDVMGQPLSMRPYQEGQVAGIRTAFGGKRRAPLLVSPTGSGKGAVIAFVVAGASLKGNRTLVVAHRREIIDQLSAKLSRYGVDHGVIMANHQLHRPHAPVQVASIQTLVRRMEKVDYGEFNFIVVDEAHHIKAATYLKVLDFYKAAKVLGATATPVRADGKGLGDVFDDLVQTVSIAQLVAGKWLAPVDGFSYAAPDFTKFKAKGNDYSEQQRDDMMRDVVLSGSIIKDYLRDAKDQRTIAFAVNVKHSLAIVEQARGAGIPAEHVDDSTPAHVRKAMLGPGGRLERGETMFVSNVGIATEGTDIPAIECVVLGNPCDSLGLIMQMIGRGLRPWCFDCRDAPNENCHLHHRVKAKCRVHDHAGVFIGRHATTVMDCLFDPAFRWTLDEDAPTVTGRTGQRFMRRCAVCKCMTADMACAACPACGVPFQSGGEVRIHEDEQAQRITLDELRSRRPRGIRELTDEQLRKVHRATREEKVGEYLRLVQVQKEKQFKPGFVDKCFRDVFGHWPKFTNQELAGVEPASRPFIPLPPREARLSLALS
jgi:superfamily II DNA or RNA helicase